MANDNKVMAGSNAFPVRFSYAHFFVPEVADEDKIDKKTGEPAKFYSTQVIIDKKDKDTIAKINAAVAQVATAKLGAGKKIPTMWKLPLRNGDEEWEEKGEHLKGYFFLNCKSKGRPDVVGTRKYTEEDLARWDNENDMASPEDIARYRPKLGGLVKLAEDEIKSGDYGRITLDFYYFENESKGVAVGLGNVQKLKDGEALGGTRTSADTDFGSLDEGFDD